MKNNHFIFFVGLCVFLFSCSGGTENTDRSTNSESSTQVLTSIDGSQFLEIDLNQSLEGKTLEELRILRNSLFARQGYLFMKADLRGYFSKYSWYDSLMYERWEREEMGQYKEEPLTEEEEEFIRRISEREKQLLANNYVSHNGYQCANVNNIVNAYQFEKLEEGFIKKLAENGFAIVPNNNIQLFHLYEQNDYQDVPSFVTADLFLQLYHMYFSYLLRTVEEGIFYERMASLSEALCMQALADYRNQTEPRVKSSAGFNAIFFQVASRIFTGKNLPLPAELQTVADDEYKRIELAEDAPSNYLGYPMVHFPYSLFKPRGHYTRSDTLKNYFKAMMWLQKGEMCMDDKTFDNAIYMAKLLLNTRVESKPAIQVYESVYRPIEYLIGVPDNISVYDIAMEKSIRNSPLEVIDHKALSEKLLKLGRNRIKPEVQISCLNKINLFPQRYVFDNEILQDLVDTQSPNSKRPLPKGIDVFGVLGVTAAEQLITDYYKEPAKWSGYQPRYDKLKKTVASISHNSVYSKWIQCLTVMQEPNPKGPAFTNLPSWKKKELNTALASWAELKHDAILYAEQPFGAECGGGGPPPPITVGYVEPNVKFWKSMEDLINTTETMLEKNGLMTDEIKSKSIQIKDMATFLTQVSEKEVKGETLTEREYNTIEVIGSTVEYISISLLPHWVDNWSLVKGPDREVSVVADIYTANALNNPNKGILHVGVGPVNDIYVVVEIEGLLYLTRGAVLSYYEFLEPLDSRLTDEEWQKRIKENQIPSVPEWVKDLIYDKDPPKPDERIFYSSGC